MAEIIHAAEFVFPGHPALAAGEGNYIVPDPDDCAYAHQQFKDAGGFLNGDKDWQACLRLADRLDPSYKE